MGCTTVPIRAYGMPGSENDAERLPGNALFKPEGFRGIFAIHAGAPRTTASDCTPATLPTIFLSTPVAESDTRHAGGGPDAVGVAAEDTGGIRCASVASGKAIGGVTDAFDDMPTTRTTSVATPTAEGNVEDAGG